MIVRFVDTVIYSIYTFIFFCLSIYFGFTTGIYMGATLLTVYASNLYILNDIINNPTVSNLEISMTSTELTDSDTSEISDISGDIDIYSDCKSDFDDEINEFVKEVANEYKEKNDNETAVAREEELIADKADEREYNED